jgi:hypothetical protein
MKKRKRLGDQFAENEVMINVAQFCAERNLEVPPLFAYI